MKSISRASGANLFLMEVLVAILIFAIAASICVRIFVYADSVSDTSTALNNAVIKAETCAECFKATSGNTKEIASILQYSCENNTVFAYYDIDWLQTTKEKSAYTLVLTCIKGKNNQIDGDIIIKDKYQSKVYALSLAVPGE